MKRKKNIFEYAKVLKGESVFLIFQIEKTIFLVIVLM